MADEWLLFRHKPSGAMIYLLKMDIQTGSWLAGNQPEKVGPRLNRLFDFLFERGYYVAPEDLDLVTEEESLPKINCVFEESHGIWIPKEKED